MPERAARLQQLFHEALDLRPEHRAAFLDAACAGDTGLRREVDALLAANEAAEADAFLQASPRALAADALAAPVDRRIGPYRLLREIGQGGMGRVFLAERDDVGKTVAIKLLRDAFAGPDVVRRFLFERRVLARLDHPNVAHLLDAGTTPSGTPYLVMEYVEGEPVTVYCDRRQLGLRPRLKLFLDICDAVRYAHQNLVVHRDLKPSNILVVPPAGDGAAGQVKLLDFGIAKLLAAAEDMTVLTHTGVGAMTPAYAAPEQVRGEAVTTATDVYALGVVLYELLTGQRPYDVRGRPPSEIARIICEEEPARPSTAIARVQAHARRVHASQAQANQTQPDQGSESVTGADDDTGAERARQLVLGLERLRRDLSGDLDTIVLKALRKNPSDRYSSVDALVDDLRRHLSGRPVQARPQTVRYRVQKFVQRHRAFAAAAGLVLLLLAGFAVREGRLRAAAEAARDGARLEAQKAEQVVAFLVGLFDVSDPYAAAPVRGDTVSARTLLARGAGRVEQELASQPDVQAELLDAIGRVYTNLGLYVEAESLLTTALDRRRAVLGADHVDLAESLNSLGELMSDLGDHPAAESLFQQSLALRRRVLGAEHPQVAVGMNNLALAHYHRGDYTAAEPLFRDALALERRVLGNAHHEVAVTLNNLGSLLREKGDLDAAEAMLREALAIWRQALGPEHAQVALCMNNLGTILRRKGDYEAAEAFFREALDIRRKTLGPDHPHVATSMGNLAVVLSDQDDDEGAEALYREVLALRRRLHPAPHPRLAVSLFNLSITVLDQGAFDEAERLMLDAIGQWRAVLGEEHPEVASGLRGLGLIYLRKGDLAAAEPLFAEVLARRRRGLEVSYTDHAAALRGLARVRLAQRDTAAARALYDEAISSLRAILGEEHDHVQALVREVEEL